MLTYREEVNMKVIREAEQTNIGAGML